VEKDEVEKKKSGEVGLYRRGEGVKEESREGKCGKEEREKKRSE
jgi:hypothetical protein